MRNGVVLEEVFKEMKHFLQYIENLYYDRQILVCHPIYKNMVFVPTEVVDKVTPNPKDQLNTVRVSDLFYTSLDKKTWGTDYTKLNSRVKSAKDFYIADFRLNVCLEIQYFMLKEFNELLDAKIMEFCLVPFSGWQSANIGYLHHVTFKDVVDAVEKEKAKKQNEADQVSKQNDDRIMQFAMKDKKRREYLKELEVISKQKSVEPNQLKRKLKDLEIEGGITEIDSIIYEAAYLGKIYNAPDLTQKNEEFKSGFVSTILYRIQNLKIEDPSLNIVLTELKQLGIISPTAFNERASKIFGPLFVIPDTNNKQVKSLHSSQSVPKPKKEHPVNHRRNSKQDKPVQTKKTGTENHSPEKLKSPTVTDGADKQQKSIEPSISNHTSKSQKKKKSKFIAWLLLLFLGALGLHRTYLGQLWKGSFILVLNIAGIFGYFIPNLIIFLFEVAVLNKNVDLINNNH